MKIVSASMPSVCATRPTAPRIHNDIRPGGLSTALAICPHTGHVTIPTDVYAVILDALPYAAGQHRRWAWANHRWGVVSRWWPGRRAAAHYFVTLAATWMALYHAHAEALEDL